jgi:Putative prokaryotic signal transducing protein
MFCPKCKSEYREGFYKCADCGADLVSELPRMSADDVSGDEFVEIFSTYNYGDIAVIKSVLDGEGIHYLFQGENANLMVGGGAYARLLMKADEADRAREILQELGFLEGI